jgi:hypothetical protein
VVEIIYGGKVMLYISNQYLMGIKGRKHGVRLGEIVRLRRMMGWVWKRG